MDRAIQSPAHRQQGFILPFVALMLLIIMGISASFFNRTVDSALYSGSAKDYTQAMLVAESGSNLLLGQFAGADGVGARDVFVHTNVLTNGTRDLDDAWIDPTVIPAVPPPNLSYVYFVIAASGALEGTSPQILQRVANGEARGTNIGALGSRAIPNATGLLNVNALFVNNISSRPLLYVRDQNGFRPSTFATWALETGAEKVAMWIEVTRNPSSTRTQWLDVYICAAAQVGEGRAYVQRFLGNYTDRAGGLAPFSEASRHRGTRP